MENENKLIVQLPKLAQTLLKEHAYYLEELSI
jgi:hypothetical protein